MDGINMHKPSPTMVALLFATLVVVHRFTCHFRTVAWTVVNNLGLCFTSEMLTLCGAEITCGMDVSFAP